LHVFALWRMMRFAGYVSTRHTLMLIVVGCVFAAVTLWWVAGWGARLWPRWAWRPRDAVGAITALLLVIGAVPLRNGRRQHRGGPKAAGLWLAQHAAPEDAILDPFEWAEFYSGRFNPVYSDAVPPRLFVILETSDNRHSRLPRIPQAKALSVRGTLV